MNRILITGGSGFLGRHVIKEFLNNGYVHYVDRFVGDKCILTPSSQDLDLTNFDKIFDFLRDYEPDGVIHLAAKCGGIGYNQTSPVELMQDNLRMGINVLEASYCLDVEKILLLSTVCAYPKYCPIPFKEEDLWNGYPEETNAPYAIAKKSVSLLGESYSKQHGMNVVTLVPINLAGEYDHFDLENSHFIPALIRKFHEAKLANQPSVTLWGTGKASREILYAGDCARAIRMAFETYNEAEPVNIGTGVEHTIEYFANLIARKIGYEGSILWDSSRPDGQPRRCLDTRRAQEKFGFVAQTGEEEIIDRTIKYYLEEIAK